MRVGEGSCQTGIDQKAVAACQRSSSETAATQAGKECAARRASLRADGSKRAPLLLRQKVVRESILNGDIGLHVICLSDHVLRELGLLPGNISEPMLLRVGSLGERVHDRDFLARCAGVE